MVSAVTINCSIDCITQCCSADDGHVTDNAVVTQLQKSVADLLAEFQQFSSHVETKLASVHSKVVVLEKSSTEVERKLAMLVTVMNCSQQDAQLRDVVAQQAGSVLGNTKNVHEGRANLNHLQDQMEEINATVQTNIEAIAAFSGRLNAHKENVQKRSTVNERAAIHSDSVDELATQVEELGNNLTSKLEALEAQTAHSTGCVQYLPTSCQQIAEKWPNSFSGHYQILSGNDTITVYCYITSPSKPAPSCEAMMSLNLTIPAGEYWVTVENGSSQRVFCPSQSQPVLSCKNLFEMNPQTPAGAYWTLRNYTTGTVHKEFCTSYEHPADSCDTILKSHPTIPSKYYWVENESEPIGKYCLRNDEEHPGESCDSILKLSSTIRPDLYWVGEGDGVHAVFCDNEERTAPSCESILKHLDIIPVEKKFLPHWVSIGNSAVQVICTSESHRWLGTCDELLLRNSTAGLYWIKDSKDQVYCTSANKPAPSCEPILEVFNTNFSLTQWIEDGNSSSEVVCTSESNRWPGTCYDLLENCSSGVKAGLYWLKDNDTQVYCTSECKRAPSCDQVLNVSHAGLYWISGYGNQVYCTSANKPADSCESILEVFNRYFFVTHWIEDGNSSSEEVCTSESRRWSGTCYDLLENCSSGVKAGLYWLNDTQDQVYCTSECKRAPSCDQVLNVSHAGLYWINGSSRPVYCTSANKPADSCEPILEVYNNISNSFLTHWIEDGNSSSEVVCTSESNRWPGTCYDLLENCSSGVRAGLYWLKDSDTQVYCTSECKRAPSCDQVLNVSHAGLYWINGSSRPVYCTSANKPADSCEPILEVFNNISNSFLTHWIEDGNSSSEVVCTSESHAWPGTCYHLLEEYSSGVKAGLYWLKINDTSVQVYCTSANKPASSCDQVFEASDTVPAGLYWISTENFVGIDHNMQGLYGENCISHNRTAVQFYCSSQAHPAPSCEAVFDYSCPTNPPGLYWISTPSGSPESVYCTPHNQCCNSTRGWMRAKYLNMSDPTQTCPHGFTARIDHNKRTCVKPNDIGCTPINIHTYGVEYNKICGKLIAYQIGTTKAFKYVHDNIIVTSNDSYVDGVSITHGPEHSRTHIWTFAAAADELFADSWTCPCSVTDTKFTGKLPDFIENDYFCDTAGYNGTRGYTFYHKNPLWDGVGCGPDSSCCTFNSPPWFCKHLPQPTTDDIEIRVCTTRSECDTALEMIEMYIQ